MRPWSQRPVRGSIRVQAGRRFAPAIDLANNGEHHWYPVAPASPAEARFEAPDLCFQGTAYHDMNQGRRPLEDDFVGWDWSRLTPRTAPSADEGLISYDIRTRENPGEIQRRLFAFDRDSLRLQEPGETRLSSAGRGLWGVERQPVSDPHERGEITRRLEDSPFYTRSLAETRIGGVDYHGVHESLAMDRFVSPITQLMLPFRIRRR
jgi:carotenoid 1,2-hydratase